MRHLTWMFIVAIASCTPIALESELSWQEDNAPIDFSGQGLASYVGDGQALPEQRQLAERAWDAEAEDRPSLTFDGQHFDPEEDVLTNLERIDAFTTLVEALTMTGLVDALLPENTPQMGWTLFAPTNEAFEASGVRLEAYNTYAELDALAKVLLYHLTWGGPFGLSGAGVGPYDPPCTPFEVSMPMASGDWIVAGDADSGWSALLLVGNDCEGRISANNVEVIASDNLVANSGMIHVIDEVLRP